MVHRGEQQSNGTDDSFEPILLAPKEQVVRHISIAKWLLNRHCGEACVIITNRRVIYRSQTDFLFLSRAVRQEADLSSVIGVQQKAGRQLHWWIVILGLLLIILAAAIDYWDRASLRQLYSFGKYSELPLFLSRSYLIFMNKILLISSKAASGDSLSLFRSITVAVVVDKRFFSCVLITLHNL